MIETSEDDRPVDTNELSALLKRDGTPVAPATHPLKWEGATPPNWGVPRPRGGGMHGTYIYNL